MRHKDLNIILSGTLYLTDICNTFKFIAGASVSVSQSILLSEFRNVYTTSQSWKSCEKVVSVKNVVI